MMRKHLAKFVTVAGIFAIALSLLTPQAVFAGKPAETVTPKIVVQKDGVLVISFGGQVKDKVSVARQLDAYLAEALDRMNSSSGFMPDSILGFNQMYDSEQENYGNSYLQGSFTTSASWSSSPASFWGTSSSAWYGTQPQPLCDEMYTSHHMTVSNGYITQLPTGDWGTNGLDVWSPIYSDEDTWYLGTTWSNLKASYPGGAMIDQETTCDYDFPQDPPPLYPSDSMTYGS